jgi:hypothetical protein
LPVLVEEETENAIEDLKVVKLVDLVERHNPTW